MAALPLNLTAFGIGSDKLGDFFHIYFMSCHTNVKLYLGDEELTEDLSKALTSDDINFVAGELTNLLNDEGFLEYLEGSLVF